MKRLLAAVSVAFLVTACSGLHLQTKEPTTETDQVLFLKGLDELLAGNTSPALNQLATRSLSSIWQSRAKALLAWKSRMHTEEQGTSSNLQQQLRNLRGTNEKLAQENASLSHDIQELKRIMVEMEKRGK